MDKRKFNSRPKGSKNKRPYPLSGAQSHIAKLWDVYRWGKFVGTYRSTTEVAKVIDKTPMRCWQMANGYNGGTTCGKPITSRTGWTVLNHGEEWGWWEET